MADRRDKGETSQSPRSLWQIPAVSDAAPSPLLSPDPPRRDKGIMVTAAVSVALHLLVLALLFLPRPPPSEATEPRSIAVELVPPPPSELSSEQPVSSEAPSSELSSQPPSSEQPSSVPPSSEAPSSADSSAPVVSALQSSEAPSSAPSAEASSMAQASSAEPSGASSAEPSSAEPSSGEPPSGHLPSGEPSSAAVAASASSAEAPKVPPARPIVIPVGPEAASSELASSMADVSGEASSDAASELPSEAASSAEPASEEVLTASGEGANDGVDTAVASASASAEDNAQGDAPPPPGSLLAAKRFYLSAMLDAPAMAQMKAALKKLPPEKRLAQTCNLETIGQIGNAGRGLSPNALVGNAFAAPVTTATTYSAANAAFRSGSKWYGIAYDCTLSKDLTKVTKFSFRIGGDVTAAMTAKFGKQ